MEKYNKKKKKKLGRERRAGFGLGGVVCRAVHGSEQVGE